MFSRDKCPKLAGVCVYVCKNCDKAADWLRFYVHHSICLCAQPRVITPCTQSITPANPIVALDGPIRLCPPGPRQLAPDRGHDRPRDPQVVLCAIRSPCDCRERTKSIRENDHVDICLPGVLRRMRTWGTNRNTNRSKSLAMEKCVAIDSKHLTYFPSVVTGGLS